MSSPDDRAHSNLIRRLRKISALGEADEQAIRQLPVVRREVGTDQDIVTEGQPVDHCCLVLDGFTHRYRMLSDGRRQIIAFHIPGDIPDLQSLHLRRLDHGFAATVRSTVAFIPHDRIWSLCVERPRVAAALWLETLIDAAIFREWIVGLGRRSSSARVAHIFCEIAVRMSAVDLHEGGTFRIPLTQIELADALGLSVVSVNRILQDFKAEGLLARDRFQVEILNWPQLAALAEFDATYLHFRQDERHRIVPEGR